MTVQELIDELETLNPKEIIIFTNENEDEIDYVGISTRWSMSCLAFNCESAYEKE